MNAKNVIVIGAVSQNGVYGQGVHIPWKSKKDMDFFKKVTTGHAVVMGRGTWESLPEKFRPLPDRENFVVTNTPNYEARGAQVVASPEQGIALAESETVFLIGGIDIWLAGLRGLANMFYISKIGLVLPIDNGTHLAPELLVLPTLEGFSCFEEEEVSETGKDGSVLFSVTFSKYRRLA